MKEKHHFSVQTHLNPVSQPRKTQLKNIFFASFFIFDSTVSRKMDHFDISFACSFFSKSREVTYRGFLGMAHLPVSPSGIVVGKAWSADSRGLSLNFSKPDPQLSAKQREIILKQNFRISSKVKVNQDS